jgi:hypothetical protein
MAVVAAAALAGCRTGEDVRAGGSENVVPTTVAAVPTPAFCNAIDGILAAETDAFAGLRAAPQGVELWSGAVVPPGLEGCSVVGDRRFAAQYICWGDRVRDRAGLDRLTPAFTRMQTQIDTCLAGRAGPVSRGPVRSFAGGERLAVWRGNGSPAPGLALRLEEDIGGGGYTLSLSGVTLR